MIYTIDRILDTLFMLLEFAIFVEIIASWIPNIQGNKFVIIIHNFIYPLLLPFKNLQDRIMPGLPMDFSPILLLIIIDIVKEILRY